jgi:hypothetical protein
LKITGQVNVRNPPSFAPSIETDEKPLVCWFSLIRKSALLD